MFPFPCARSLPTVRPMLRRSFLPLLCVLMAASLIACSDDDGAESSTDGATEAEGAAGEVTTGDGWSATFPGEVERSSRPIEVPGSQEAVDAQSTTWQSNDEAITVMTIAYPAEAIAAIDAPTLLEQTARNNGELLADSPLLDGDGTFAGRPAVVFEQTEGDITTTGLAMVDDTHLVQLLHVDRDGSADTFASFVASFELTGR